MNLARAAATEAKAAESQARGYRRESRDEGRVERGLEGETDRHHGVGIALKQEIYGEANTRSQLTHGFY